MDEKNALSVVEDLIETCKDGQKGYQDAASHAKRSDLKTYFNQQSLERASFAGELEAILIQLGKPDKKVSGSVAASLHRAWIDTKVSSWRRRPLDPGIGGSRRRQCQGSLPKSDHERSAGKYRADRSPPGRERAARSR